MNHQRTLSLLARPIYGISGRPIRVPGSSLSLFQARRASSSTDATNSPIDTKPDFLHGSWHWTFERAVAVANMGLLGALVALSPNAYVDLGLTFVLPLHAYLGMDAIITDYLPSRKFPLVHKLVKGSLIGATVLTIYGFYKFNTNDIGLGAFVKTAWHADRIAKPRISHDDVE